MKKIALFLILGAFMLVFTFNWFLLNQHNSIADAIVEFYDNTLEPIIFYEQMPFEEGTLVLA